MVEPAKLIDNYFLLKGDGSYEICVIINAEQLAAEREEWQKALCCGFGGCKEPAVICQRHLEERVNDMAKRKEMDAEAALAKAEATATKRLSDFSSLLKAVNTAGCVVNPIYESDKGMVAQVVNERAAKAEARLLREKKMRLSLAFQTHGYFKRMTAAEQRVRELEAKTGFQRETRQRLKR
jgi:hypothetical protein